MNMHRRATPACNGCTSGCMNACSRGATVALFGDRRCTCAPECRRAKHLLIEKRRETAGRGSKMKLIHLIFAIVTLAAVSAIAIAGPSQADGASDLYLREVVAS